MGKHPMLAPAMTAQRCDMTSRVQPTFLVERYAADLSGDQLLSAGRRAEEAAALLTPGAQARYLGSILLPSDEMAFCLFEGTSEEVIRGAVASADLAFERITQAVQVNGPMDRATRAQVGEVDDG